MSQIDGTRCLTDAQYEKLGLIPGRCKSAIVNMKPGESSATVELEDMIFIITVNEHNVIKVTCAEVYQQDFDENVYLCALHKSKGSMLNIGHKNSSIVPTLLDISPTGQSSGISIGIQDLKTKLVNCDFVIIIEYITPRLMMCGTSESFGVAIPVTNRMKAVVGVQLNGLTYTFPCKDWTVIEANDTTVSLKHISGAILTGKP